METNCIIYVNNGSPFDISNILGQLSEVARGKLTTDHAASSYGQPVLVLEGGRIFGPGDIPAKWEIGVAEMDNVDAQNLHSAFDKLRPSPR